MKKHRAQEVARSKCYYGLPHEPQRATTMMNTTKHIAAATAPLLIIIIILLLRVADIAAALAAGESSQQSDDFGRSLVRTTAEVCQPRHIHLSVGRIQNATHSSMTVSFSISSACVGKKGPGTNSVGAVRLSGERDDDVLVVGDIDDAKSYSAMSPRKGVKRYYSDLYYHVEIEDLRPGQEYSYECLLLTKDDMSSQQYLRQDKSSKEMDHASVMARSDILTFTTPPAPGQWYASGRAIKFAVLGDLAAREHSRKTIRHLDHQSKSANAILFAGDLAYPSKDHENWDKWMDMMSERDFFSSIPTQIALGNHDLDTYKGGWNYTNNESIEIALAYEHRFQMPQIRPPIRELASWKEFTVDGQPKDFLPYEYGNAYYSFTFGPSKHIVLSSFSSFREGSLQHDWLLSELKSVDRSVTPWLIVMLHCPLYTTFKTHRKEIFITEARAILEPLFVDYTVNFVIAGHIHAYMRTHPMAFSRRNPRGPIHIIQGNGGKAVGQSYYNETAEEWVDVRDQSQYGYGTLELFNNTHAKWRWIKTGYDEGGEF